MVIKKFIILLAVMVVQAQINGEFWWMNEKLDKYRKVRPSKPKIEELSDWETDESVKIVFRDDNEITDEVINKTSVKTNTKKYWTPVRLHRKIGQRRRLKDSVKLLPPSDTKETEDTFVFNFPGKINDNFNIDNTNSNATITADKNITIYDTIIEENLHNLNGKMPTNIFRDEASQSICTFIPKSECNYKKGTVYYFNYERFHQKSSDEKICCIFPIPPATQNYNFIQFPDMTTKRPKKRLKRADNENTSLNQRKFLLMQKFATANRKKPSPTTPTKIVTPSDDYSDPYWNIKNSKFHENHKTETEKYDHYEDEEDYASELPRPGLVGLYSDHAMSPTSWTFGKGYGGTFDYKDDDSEEDTFGYSTLDPRKGEKVKKQNPRPIKLTTSGELTYNAESQTINFQSNPDFQVLQGFKLLNVVRNKSTVFTRAPNEDPNDSRESSVLVDDSDYEGDEFYEEDQLFGDCGKFNAVNERDREAGEAPNGSHPWSALVVLTKRRQNILCYATLIHPRAAITVADCVDGTATKDITVLAGLWNLNDRSTSRNRVATVHVHPKYKPGEVDNNLAILYWMRPLKLGVNIQPACLGEPHAGDECKFFGWGGLNNGIQPKSKWQRASIKSCNSRIRLNKRGTKHSEAFCATVSRNIVTGMGGPLICDIDGHSSVVGIVVSRENGYKLTPVREFAMKSNELLQSD